ncbi:MAG TPA: hypothetical protein VGM30_20515 [Puia sp.]|jgi:hypothetical protein
MKLFLILCAFVLSIHGWCASVTPFQRTSGTTAVSHPAIEKVRLPEQTSSPMLLNNMEVALIGCALLLYFTAISWLAITAKHSLDKILKDVLQAIARYS